MMPKLPCLYRYTTDDYLNSIIENTIDILMATIASISRAFSIDSALSLAVKSGVGRIHFWQLATVTVITTSKMVFSITNHHKELLSP